MREMQRRDNIDDPLAYSELVEQLLDWGISGDYEVYHAWVQYQQKNILPFSGGWLEQPKWIRRAFSTLNKVYALHYLGRNRPTLESIGTANNLFSFSIKAEENGSERHEANN